MLRARSKGSTCEGLDPLLGARHDDCYRIEGWRRPRAGCRQRLHSDSERRSVPHLVLQCREALQLGEGIANRCCSLRARRSRESIRGEPRARADAFKLVQSLEPVVHPTMPIQDAIDLVHLLVDTTCGYVRFAPGPATVAPPIDSAAITRHDGFRWIRRKHYYSQESNLPMR
jgi:hypothetical protein